MFVAWKNLVMIYAFVAIGMILACGGYRGLYKGDWEKATDDLYTSLITIGIIFLLSCRDRKRLTVIESGPAFD